MVQTAENVQGFGFVMRRLSGATACAVAFQLAACTNGPSEVDHVDVVAVGLGAAAKMPEPETRRVPTPDLDPQEQARADEVDAYLARRYDKLGYKIVATTQTYIGDVVDWVDPDTIPGAYETPPPPIDKDGEENDPGPGMELEAPELRGPPGTVPFIRPAYMAYIRPPAGNEGRERYKSIEKFIEGQQQGQPNGKDRLYGGFQMFDNISAVVANLQVWEEGTLESDTFSLAEISVACNGPNNAPNHIEQDIVGATVSRDRSNFNNPADAPARLQVEVYHKDPGGMPAPFSRWAQAPYVYWVPSSSAPYSPGAAYNDGDESTIDGNQYDYRYEWLLFNGNWWLNHRGNWLGYYPANILPFFQANDQGCYASWYGEVFDNSESTWTSTNMGSGRFASAGWKKSAYIRKPFYVDGTGTSLWAEGTGAADDSSGVGTGGVRMDSTAAIVDPACYTTSGMKRNSGSSTWPRYFYFGGPGGDATGCM